MKKLHIFSTTLEMWVALIVTLDVVCLFVCLGHSLQICGTDSKAALADSYWYSSSTTMYFWRCTVCTFYSFALFKFVWRCVKCTAISIIAYVQLFWWVNSPLSPINSVQLLQNKRNIVALKVTLLVLWLLPVWLKNLWYKILKDVIWRGKIFLTALSICADQKRHVFLVFIIVETNIFW